MNRQISVFYVYVEQDEALQEALEKHLALLHRQGVIARWQQSLAGHDGKRSRNKAWATLR